NRHREQPHAKVHFARFRERLRTLESRSFCIKPHGLIPQYDQTNMTVFSCTYENALEDALIQFSRRDFQSTATRRSRRLWGQRRWHVCNEGPRSPNWKVRAICLAKPLYQAAVKQPLFRAFAYLCNSSAAITFFKNSGITTRATS